MESWADTGIYSGDSVDLILHILSQVLDLRLLIVEETCPEHINELELLPHRNDNPLLTPMNTVILIKEGEHFNYAVLVKQEYVSVTQASDPLEVIVVGSSSDSDTESFECNPKIEQVSPSKDCTRSDPKMLIRCYKDKKAYKSGYFSREMSTMDDVFVWLETECFLETLTQSFAPGMPKKKLQHLFGGKRAINLNIVTYDDCSSHDDSPCKKPKTDIYSQTHDVPHRPMSVISGASRGVASDKIAPCSLAECNVSDIGSHHDEFTNDMTDGNIASRDRTTNSSSGDKYSPTERFAAYDQGTDNSTIETSRDIRELDAIYISDGSSEMESATGAASSTDDTSDCSADSDGVDENRSSSYYVCNDSKWHGKDEVPVYELSNKVPYYMQKVCDLLLTAREDEVDLCTDRPLCCRQDAVFLLDLEHVHKEDIVADGNGTYSRELRHYRWVVKQLDGGWKHMHVEKVGVYVLKPQEVFLYWNTYLNPGHGLRRQINYLCDNDGNVLGNVAFLQYNLRKGISTVNFIPRRHGNAKKHVKPFLGKLSKSVINRLKGKARLQKAGTTIMEEENQDPLCENPCNQPLPSTVYNIRCRSKTKDPLQEILDFNEEMDEDIIIGQHGAPGITLVFQSEYMRGNSRFIENDTVLQTDTTFGNHNFYVTCITLQDKSLLNQANTHPWVMLAVAFHEKKEFRVHEMIVQDVINATPALRKQKVTVITDDETALWKAWKPYAHLLRCCNHFQRNCVDYLRHDLHIAKEECTNFLHVVFRPGGLVDSEDRKQYEARLEEVKPEFDAWEMVAANKQAGHSNKAHRWLQNRSKSVSKRLLKCARRKAAFPVHNRPYTNGVEGFNCRFQETQKGNSFSGTFSYLEYLEGVILKIEKSMQVSFTKALIGQGNLHLSAEFEQLTVPVHVWVSLTQTDKRAYITKAQKAKKGTVISIEEENQPSIEQHDHSMPHCVTATLLNRGIPQPTVTLMVSGAEDILNNPSAMAKCPGRPNHYIVTSKTTNGLNTCTINTYNVTCTCRGYKSKVTCKHGLAVAHAVDKLEPHLDWLRKQPTTQNKTALLTQSNAGTGQKGGKPKSKPRNKARDSDKVDLVSRDDTDYNPAFTKCYHNNKPFKIIHKKGCAAKPLQMLALQSAI